MAKLGRIATATHDRSILAMSGMQARAFLLRHESYCGIELPDYFVFGRLLSAVSNEIANRALSSMSRKVRDHEDVNYSFLSNKDGRYAWRPFQIIHPALYVSLVNLITARDNWKTIRDRFAQLQQLPRISVLSIPLQSSPAQSAKQSRILGWWQGIEQASIEMALEFNYVFHADIADCYASIYTHSIAWAIHGKSVAKAKRKDASLIGNIIDSTIQDMRQGQTNGIPQGSVLMDFIAEIVLGYADSELGQKLSSLGISDYRILRFRDDYRIFVVSPQVGEVILKSLTEILSDLGLKLSPTKTGSSSAVIVSSLKPDKHVWIRSKQSDPNLQRQLLLIHAHGTDFPNSGSLLGALTDFCARLDGKSYVQNPRVLISIAVDIAYHNPRIFPVCAAIISLLLRRLGTRQERLSMIGKIHERMSQLPNTGHFEVWLQRVTHPFAPKLGYAERLCRLVAGTQVDLWNNDWITSTKLKATVDPRKAINQSALRSLKPVIKPKEISAFASRRY